MCYLIRCYPARPHEQGHWPASARAHYKPSPFSLSVFLSLSPLIPLSPLSVLPMNVSISLPMCKLFSPALRADGEQCLCRDFLCMSFLISLRVTRFPCPSPEKKEVSAHTHAYIHCVHAYMCTRVSLALTICNQYARRVVGILVRW